MTEMNTHTDAPLTRRQLREAAQQAFGTASVATQVAPESPEASEEISAEETTTPLREGERRERGLVSYLLTGLMGGILILVLGIGALAIVIPQLTGSTALTVMTSSMEPGLPPGTMVVVKPTPVNEIKPGDVVTYQLNSGDPTLITHRVTPQLKTVDGEYQFITKGDNNPSADPDPVMEVQVRGTVWYSIPYIGWVSQALTGELRALIVPAVVGLLFVYAAWMFISGLRDKKKKSDA